MFAVAVSVIASTMSVVSCSKNDATTNPTPPSGTPTLHAASVSTAPTLDGDDGDGAWSSAQWTTVHMKPITVPGNTLTNEFDLQIKSVHTAGEIFFLVKYPDADADETPNKLMFTGGDPAVQANWTNVKNGQDGLSFMWDMMLGGKSARDAGGKFSDSSYGCAAACHTTKSYQQLESGMFPDSGELDVWQWCAGTTNQQGYADDGYAVGGDSNGTLDFSRRNKDALQEKWFADANYSVAKPSYPDNMSDATNGGLDKARFLSYSSAVSFKPASPNPATGSAWAAGDIVPGWALRVVSTLGSETDVRAKGKHAGGTWTIELKRPLATLYSEQDVQFAAGWSYAFSVAVHEAARKYTDWEYRALSNYQPPHYGCVPRRLTLAID